MIETMKFYGHTAVAPTLHKDRELCEKPYVYFQEYIRAWFAGNIAEKPLWVDQDDHEPFIEWWFEQNKETLWQVVLKYFGWRCLLSNNMVATNTCHEIISRGAASNERALVPWNMVPISVILHKLVHAAQGYRIINFDPLDNKDGLIVLDPGMHRIVNGEMWFYNKPCFEDTNNANYRRELVIQWAKQRVAGDWAIAPILAIMREESDYKALGEPTHKAMLSGMQNNEEDDKRFYVDSALCNSLEKALDKAIERNAVDLAMLVDPPRSMKIMKRIEDNKEMREFLVKTSYMSRADFNEEWKIKYANTASKDPGHRDAIEAICECGDAHLKVHRHVLEGDDDEFGMMADYTVDNGEAVHTDGETVEIVIDKEMATGKEKECE